MHLGSILKNKSDYELSAEEYKKLKADARLMGEKARSEASCIGPKKVLVEAKEAKRSSFTREPKDLEPVNIPKSHQEFSEKYFQDNFTGVKGLNLFYKDLQFEFSSCENESYKKIALLQKLNNLFAKTPSAAWGRGEGQKTKKLYIKNVKRFIKNINEHKGLCELLAKLAGDVGLTPSSATNPEDLIENFAPDYEWFVKARNATDRYGVPNLRNALIKEASILKAPPLENNDRTSKAPETFLNFLLKQHRNFGFTLFRGKTKSLEKVRNHLKSISGITHSVVSGSNESDDTITKVADKLNKLSKAISGSGTHADMKKNIFLNMASQIQKLNSSIFDPILGRSKSLTEETTGAEISNPTEKTIEEQILRIIEDIKEENYNTLAKLPNCETTQNRESKYGSTCKQIIQNSRRDCMTAAFFGKGYSSSHVALEELINELKIAVEIQKQPQVKPTHSV
jgi:hypothetical protein